MREVLGDERRPPSSARSPSGRLRSKPPSLVHTFPAILALPPGASRHGWRRAVGDRRARARRWRAAADPRRSVHRHADGPDTVETALLLRDRRKTDKANHAPFTCGSTRRDKDLACLGCQRASSRGRGAHRREAGSSTTFTIPWKAAQDARAHHAARRRPTGNRGAHQAAALERPVVGAHLVEPARGRQPSSSAARADRRRTRRRRRGGGRRSRRGCRGRRRWRSGERLEHAVAAPAAEVDGEVPPPPSPPAGSRARRGARARGRRRGCSRARRCRPASASRRRTPAACRAARQRPGR